MRLDLEGKIPKGLGDAEGALATAKGTFRFAPGPERFGHKSHHPAEPALIVQGLDKGFGLQQVIEERLWCPKAESTVRRPIQRSIACSEVSRTPGDARGP